MRNNHIALPLSPTNSAAVHWAVPIAPRRSLIAQSPLTWFSFKSLALKFLLVGARGRVSKNTNSTISVKRLLTTASRY